MNLAEQVVLIVGAAGGIGRAVAARVAKAGSRVVLADLDGDRLQVLKEELLPASGVITVETDITKKADTDKVVETTVSKFGRIDTLINSAGICDFVGFDEITDQMWERMLAVNLKGPFELCRKAASVMIKQKNGNMINVASLAGENAPVYAGLHYAVSKSGLITMSKIMAKTLARHGIRVNVVSPGPVETEMLNCWTEQMRDSFCSGIPLGRFAEPEDIAGAICYLAGPDSSYMTGQVLRVNGGALV